MRGAVTASALVHVALLAGMFAFQTRAPRLMVGPEVVQVALLEPTALAAAAPVPPRREPDPSVSRIEPDEGTGVKLAPAKPKPKPKEEKPSPKPDKAEPQPTMALSNAPMGRAGLRGDASVDAADFEFSYYLVLVRNRIAQNWSPPAGLVAGSQPIRAVVYFRIDREGRVVGARLEAPSPAEFFDRSALRAVVLSDPLPPLPAGFTGGTLGVHFGFEYTSP